MTLTALIFCQIEHKSLIKVVEKFKEIPKVQKVFSLTGDYDVLAELIVDSTEELYEIFANKIDLIDGIIETNTHMIMKFMEKIKEVPFKSDY